MSVEGQVIPDLKIVHKYPDMYPKFTVDEGAIKFILKGIFFIDFNQVPMSWPQVQLTNTAICNKFNKDKQLVFMSMDMSMLW